MTLIDGTFTSSVLLKNDGMNTSTHIRDFHAVIWSVLLKLSFWIRWPGWVWASSVPFIQS